VGVEHELSPAGEPQLADAPLPLALNDGVGEFRRLEAGAGRIVVEEVTVQVEAVDRVVLEDVDQINAHHLVATNANRVVHVDEWDAVDCVQLITLPIEGGVVAVLH